jgi:hypothetical protein
MSTKASCGSTGHSGVAGSSNPWISRSSEGLRRSLAQLQPSRTQLGIAARSRYFVCQSTSCSPSRWVSSRMWPSLRRRTTEQRGIKGMI